MLYEGEHVSIAALPGMRERTIVLDGFSQDLRDDRLAAGLRRSSRTSWSPHVARLMTNANSCTATFTQLAGVAALDGSQEPSDGDGGGVP